MKAYLINLDRSPERLAYFSAQARQCGLVFERISAVDGRRMSAAERTRAVAQRFEFQPLNPGEIGVFMSHRLAWQALVDSGEPCAAVFEDDVALSTHSGALLQALAAGLQPQATAPWPADIVKLETTLRQVVMGPVLGTLPLAAVDAAAGSSSARAPFALQPLCSWHGGAAAYVITQPAARRLLAATWPLADPVDQLLFNPMSRTSASLRLLQLSPALAVQQNILDRRQRADPVFGSTIERPQTRGRLLRHGLLIDLKRAWTKQRERWRRQRLAHAPGHVQQTVAFDAPAQKTNA